MSTILVVDDEISIRDLITRFLKSAGHFGMTAGNGLEAVAVFRSHARAIDLVLTDMTMPVMGGAEAVARIRETRPEVPVICMSGYTNDRIPPGALFLPKPFNPVQLLALIAQALDH